MTLTPVKSLPKRTTFGYNDLEKVLKEFVSSGMTIARIDYRPDEYRSHDVLYSGVHVTIKRLGLTVKVCMRNGEVYLMRT